VIEPQVVVLHWTAGPTADSAWNTFRPETLAGRPELDKGGTLNVSAQFLVDRDGTIARLMPETWMARHAIGLNHVAIGIENVGGPELPLTDAQADADAALVRWLAATYPIELVIGHHEAARLEGSRWWREDVAGYRNEKPDPGDVFVAAVRARVADLGLGDATAR
jgi:N-acetyl-anhydromuramyl-L-alanine amidase AmpD